MTDPRGPIRGDGGPDDELVPASVAGGAGYEIEGDAVEPEAPRRAASAQFVVARGAGADASMRDAMDPANQSLAEALRLSYRVLQFVILALVVLFLFSGFQTIQEGNTGVRTLFGRIYGDPGQEQLSPGFTPFWPYPAGDIVTLPLRRSVELDRAFFPTFRNNNVTFDQAIESASISELLKPGIDGYLLSADGDIVHLKLGADYTIDDAVDFLKRIAPAKADLVVDRMLRRAVVRAGAGLSTAEIVDSREEPLIAVRELAQKSLDEIASGLTLADVRLPLRTVALAVRKETPKVQSSREESKAAVERAKQDAEKALNGAAGKQYPALIAAIDRYEDALSGEDPAAAEQSLAELVKLLEGPETSGEAALIISRARAYRAQVESTLGNDYRRFASILPAWRRDPQLVVRRLWLDAYNEVLAGDLVEVFSVPDDLGQLLVRIRSSDTMMQDRRKAELDRRKGDFAAGEISDGPYLLRGRDTADPGGRNRRLERGADVGFGKDR